MSEPVLPPVFCRLALLGPTVCSMQQEQTQNSLEQVDENELIAAEAVGTLPMPTVKELVFASEQALSTAKMAMVRGDARAAESALRLAKDLHRQAVAVRQSRLHAAD